MLTSSALQAFRQTDPYEVLISNIILLESETKFRMEDEKTAHETRKSVLSDLDSRLSALDSILERLTDPISHPFDGRTITLDSSSGFSATTSDAAAFGSHSLTVNRLASVDTRLSNKHTSADTSIVGAIGSGTKSFTISVASPTDLDPNNRVDVAVSVNITGSTDEEVLTQVSSAINNAMLSAVDSDAIERDDRAFASVLNETSGTARLSLRAGDTGYTNRLSFSADPDGLLAQIGISNNALAAGDVGGYATDIGTSEDTSELNSKFVLDGLTIYRDGNQVSDALDGVTFTLRKVTTDPEGFTVTPDASGIEDEVNDFIQKYNDILSYVKSKGRVNGDTGERGAFAGDTTFTSLRFSMREDIVRIVPDQPTDSVKQITDLGIKVNSDGSLKLEDPEKLIAAVEADPDTVRSFFAGEDGVATRLSTRLDQYLGFNGFVNQRQRNMDDRIRNLNHDIADEEDRLARREERLRAEFARLQEALQIYQGQAASLSAIGR
ncbi:MAG: flagellar filament capping protein FliD [Rhodothermales bacterium]